MLGESPISLYRPAGLRVLKAKYIPASVIMAQGRPEAARRAARADWGKNCQRMLERAEDASCGPRGGDVDAPPRSEASLERSLAQVVQMATLMIAVAARGDPNLSQNGYDVEGGLRLATGSANR